MIQFKQKIFAEYDAMRSFYVELMRSPLGRDRMFGGTIDQKALIPILKGNNVVVERFVSSTYAFRKDRYRMYLKIGAKAKLPDEVRLPQYSSTKRLLNAKLNIGDDAGGGGKDNNNNQQPFQKNYSDPDETRIKLFSDKKKKKGNGGGGGGQQGGNDNNGSKLPQVKAGFNIPVDITYEVRELLGDAIEYNKKDRSLVLEFSSIQDAIHALYILPFGINYKIYLLE